MTRIRAALAAAAPDLAPEVLDRLAEADAAMFRWLMSQYEPCDEIPNLRAELVKVMNREQGA